VIGVLLAVLFSAALAPAQAAEPYVVYTANQRVDGAVILRTDPATGAVVEVSRNGPQGSLFRRPYDLAVEADGSLVVADMGQPNVQDGSVIRVDPLTGRQRLVSGGAPGNLLLDPSGIAIGPGGQLFVLDTGVSGSVVGGGVWRVDPQTGAQELYAWNFVPLPRLFSYPFGIAVAGDGTVIVANRTLLGELPLGCLLNPGSVFRVDPDTKAHSLIASGAPLSFPFGLTIDPATGDLIVANECGGTGGVGLVRVSGGLQTVITPNGEGDVLRTPERVAIAPDGSFLVTDFALGAQADGGIVKVAPGGAQSPLSTDELFNGPLGIAVVANRPPAAALSVAPGLVAPGQPVSLDASRSSDPEGQRLVYDWDLNGDGGFEAASGMTPTASPRFAGDGVKTVRVRVTDLHGGQAVAQGSLRVDGSTPLVTGLRATATVLGVGTARKRSKARKRRRGRASASPPRSTSLRFRLSEPATVTIGLERARKGRRARSGKCSTRRKRGRRCTIWSGVRSLDRRGQAGGNSIPLSARGLKPGHYRVSVTAVDEVGNRSARRQIRLRVVRLGG
jgi:sugar lactone lactonase YvrE